MDNNFVLTYVHTKKRHICSQTCAQKGTTIQVLDKKIKKQNKQEQGYYTSKILATNKQQWGDFIQVHKDNIIIYTRSVFMYFMQNTIIDKI